MQDISVYLLLHKNVLDYKNGDNTKASFIINSFSDFLWKYVNLIHKGYFKIEDKGLRRFISLWLSSKSNVNQYKYKESARIQLTDCSTKIKDLFSQYEEAEIRNELICVLLNMAKKYCDYSKPSFHTYVERCFHFEAFRSLRKLITDPVSRQDCEEYFDYMKNDIIHEDIESIDERVDKLNNVKRSGRTPEDELRYSIYDDEILNDNWINGITCSLNFNTLTPFERKMLIEHTIKKRTDNEIGIQYGFCRATINRKRLNAIKKLKNNRGVLNEF